ncbi:nuclear transport factor 2 family protein [Pseudorhodoferax sp.]|uniref:nuclear transport factor 2 family protein n=1 Tax=Pseudorhodoferax sp. TaxID=1993553 RepID=UPI002DD674A0|nr:nuclear transport factor 2 family protein [Pseudorhodoferax sp.]
MNAVERFRHYFEQLQPADLARIGEVYGAHAHFRDPFNEVRGLAAVRRVFEHMFETLEAPRFEVLDAFGSGEQAFLTWNFRFRLRGREMQIHGSSHLKLAPDGKVIYHRDYWDAAEELWERVPLLGALLRRLKRRLRAGS